MTTHTLSDEVRARIQKHGTRSTLSLSKGAKGAKGAARTCLRLDCPPWLKDRVAALAAELDTSISQLAAFLLGYALLRYRRGDPELLELLDENSGFARALRFTVQLDPSELRDRLDELGAQPPSGRLHVPADEASEAPDGAATDENDGAAIAAPLAIPWPAQASARSAGR